MFHAKLQKIFICYSPQKDKIVVNFEGGVSNDNILFYIYAS